METLDILCSYGYPVIDRPSNLKLNAEQIVSVLKERYKGQKLQFLGTGTSGAMIMAAIAMVPGHDYETFGIVAKQNERCHRSSITDFEPDLPAVVVDDTICSGNTMERISDSLHLELREKVEVVAAGSAVGRMHLLKRLFPNVKLIIS